MREIRIFELDRPGVPVSWRSARAQTIAAQAGRLWVTQEHQLQDIWLKPGQSIEVPAGVRFWLSGEPVDGTPARFAVTEDINAPRRLLRQPQNWLIAASFVGLSLFAGSLAVHLRDRTLDNATAVSTDAGRWRPNDPRLAGAAVELDAANMELRQAMEQAPNSPALQRLLYRTQKQQSQLRQMEHQAG